MPKRFSDVVGVTSEELWAEGAFDAFVDIDAQFHIDPHLLEKTTIPELQGSYDRFKIYFEEVLRLLANTKLPGDRIYRQAIKRLKFKEFRFISLGYATEKRKGRSWGNGIGMQMAEQITATAFEIVQAGINDPIIFELVGLIEDGIGADRISDMTARIIAPDLLRFTERVARNLNLETWSLNYGSESFQIPLDLKLREPIVFVPYEILRPLPVANDWWDIDEVTVYNQKLRDALNKTIGVTWKDATNQRKLTKTELKEILGIVFV